MPDDALRAVVIGAGLAGGLSLEALVQSPTMSATACADPSADARSRVAVAHPSVDVYTNAEEMLRSADADIVCVSSPPALHAEHARLAVEYNARGVLLEKPISGTSAEARRLVADLRKARVASVVPHGLRVDPTAEAVAELARAGDIGPLETIEIRTSGWDILNAGIHWIDFALGVLDDRVSTVLAACDSSTRTFRDGLQVETAAITWAETATGVRIYMVSGDNTHLAPNTEFATITVIGSSGWATFRAFQPGYTISRADRPVERVVPANTAPTGHRAHLEHLAGLVVAGATDEPAVNRSLDALEVCEAAYRSNRLRTMVTLPLTADRHPAPLEWDPGTPYGGSGGGRDGRQL